MSSATRSRRTTGCGRVVDGASVGRLVRVKHPGPHRERHDGRGAPSRECPCVAPAKRRACCPTAPIIAHGICGSASGDGAGPSVDGLGLLTHLPRNVSIAMGRAANAGVGESLSTKHALLATGHLTTMMGRENCRHRARELRNPCVAQARVLHRGRKAGGHCRNPETSPLAACSEHDGQNCTGPPRMVPGRW